MHIVYAVYAVFGIGLTVFLAHSLSKNGQVLLEDVFRDTPALGVAVNKLLVVGFYLVNLGYACLLLRGGNATDLTSGLETLAQKMGSLLLSLAVMHFVNLFLFHRIRRRLRARHTPAPIAPHGYLQPQGGFGVRPAGA